jgi:hypothetical protein
MPKRLRTIRWSVELAASEFQIDRRTLTKRIRAGDIQPGSDGKFSTEQVCAAVFGDYRREQLREIRGRADKLELENEAFRRERIPLEDITRVTNETFSAIAGTIRANRDKVLSESLINEMFETLRDWATRHLLS